MKFATRCIHAGQEPDPTTGAVVQPIHQTTTYAQPSPGKDLGYDYSRAGNPTRTALEACIGSLENGAGGAAFSSGMAAISTLLHMLPAGSHVLCGENVYGGTHRVFQQVYEPMGFQFDLVDTRDLKAVEAKLKPETRLLFLETPSNPLMHVSDIRALCELAHDRDLMVAVDNTFMSPVFQQPLDLGADFVVHSGTKYIGGHSDVLIGFLVPRSEAHLEKLRYLQKCVGALPSPMEAWLALRSLKTLSVRMHAHEANAKKVVEFLGTRSEVAKIHYPGLESHPDHELQMRQCFGHGGAMVSFEIDSAEMARRFTENLQVFTLAESLGAVESLACVPSLMTHASVPPEHREALGLHDGLVRLSVGLEDAGDLVEDLSQALEKAG